MLLVLTDQANDRLHAPLPWKARMVWTGGFADRGAALAYGASLWPMRWNGRAARSSGMDNAALYAVAPAGDVLVGAVTLEHEHRPPCRCACAQAEAAMANLARLCAERAEDVCGLEGTPPAPAEVEAPYSVELMAARHWLSRLPADDRLREINRQLAAMKGGAP